MKKTIKKVALVTLVAAMLAVSSMSTLIARASDPRQKLQVWFNANGYTINVYTDELPWIETFPPGYCKVTILNGEHGFDNPTGYYTSSGETTTETLLFPDRPEPGETASFTSEESFGFYINSSAYPSAYPSGVLFFTETGLNVDGFDHALVFNNTKGLGYVIAFEDQWEGGDKDYEDRIIEVVIGNVPPGHDVTVNPDPDVILTFVEVITGGDATVQTSTLPPEGCPTLPRIITFYFNIEVTAIFEGNVFVGIRYDDTGMSCCKEKMLRLYVGYVGYDPVGDVNHDGIVNLKDIFLIMSALGTQPDDGRWKQDCDLNNDGHVNLKDLSIALQNFGQSFWKDITKYVDFENNIVYGEIIHFSAIFGVR